MTSWSCPTAPSGPMCSLRPSSLLSQLIRMIRWGKAALDQDVYFTISVKYYLLFILTWLDFCLHWLDISGPMLRSHSWKSTTILSQRDSETLATGGERRGKWFPSSIIGLLARLLYLLMSLNTTRCYPKKVQYILLLQYHSHRQTKYRLPYLFPLGKWSWHDDAKK